MEILQKCKGAPYENKHSGLKKILTNLRNATWITHLIKVSTDSKAQGEKCNHWNNHIISSLSSVIKLLHNQVIVHMKCNHRLKDNNFN